MKQIYEILILSNLPQNPVNPVQITGFNVCKIKQSMKSSVFAALVGLATAGGSLQSNTVQVNTLGLSGGLPAQTTTQYSATSGTSGQSSLTTFQPVYSLGAGNQNVTLTGVSDLYASSVNNIPTSAVGAIGGSASGGTFNIGTGPVVVTSASTGESSLVAGGNQSGNFPTADLGVISAAQLSGVSSSQASQAVLNNVAINSIDGPKVNLNQIFAKLPSGAEVDNLILTADSTALIKLIQAVGDNVNIPCDQRIAYLLELDGRLKAAIELKDFAATQVNQVTKTANAEIDRLQQQIARNKFDIDALGVDDLTNRLNNVLTNLASATLQLQNSKQQTPILDAKINGSLKEIDVLQANSDAERNSVNVNRLKLNEYVTQIATLQNQLQNLLNRKAPLEASIAKGEANIQSNDRAIADLRSKINGLNDQLRDLVDKTQRFDSTVKDLEVKLARVRSDIANADQRKNKLIQDNAALQARIDVERKKVGPNDANKLNIMIDNLKKSIPNIESEVDRHYYYCFGAGSVQVQTVGGLTVYVVRGDSIANYLRNLYGRNVVVPAVNGDVLFNRIDIFGPSWVGAYGYPFGQASMGTADLVIGGNFGCTAPGAITSGYGKITAVGSNFIEASNQQGFRQRFNLGTCSRLQASTKLPAVGQQFYWSGVNGSNGINLYSGSCFN